MIKEIRYETNTLPGPFIGTVVYTITLDKQATSTGEIADALLAIRNYPSNKMIKESVLFRGEIDPVFSNEIFTIAKTLKDYGYGLYAVTDGKLFYSWFGLLDWLIVRVTLKPWAGFKCHQIIFDGFKNSDPEPIVYSDKTGKHPVCYLNPDKSATTAGILSFLKQASFGWGVALPVSKAFSKLIYERTIK